MIRFLLLAFGITWVGVSPLVLGALGLGPAVPGWLHGVGALGPFLAAVSIRGRAVFSRREPAALPAGWIAVALASPLLLAVVAAVAVHIRGVPVVSPLLGTLSQPAWVVDVLVVSLAFGFGEEPGWRGALLPRLQAVRSPVRATLVLTAIWAVWHAPFFVYRYDFQGPGTLVGFLVGLLAGGFWLTFLFNSTGGSVLVVAAWHTLWNAANLTLAAVSDTGVAVLNALMMVLGFSIWGLYARRGLGIRGPVRE